MQEVARLRVQRILTENFISNDATPLKRYIRCGDITRDSIPWGTERSYIHMGAKSVPCFTKIPARQKLACKCCLPCFNRKWSASVGTKIKFRNSPTSCNSGNRSQLGRVGIEVQERWCIDGGIGILNPNPSVEQVRRLQLTSSRLLTWILSRRIVWKSYQRGPRNQDNGLTLVKKQSFNRCAFCVLLVNPDGS